MLRADKGVDKRSTSSVSDKLSKHSLTILYIKMTNKLIMSFYVKNIIIGLIILNDFDIFIVFYSRLTTVGEIRFSLIDLVLASRSQNTDEIFRT